MTVGLPVQTGAGGGCSKMGVLDFRSEEIAGIFDVRVGGKGTARERPDCSEESSEGFLEVDVRIPLPWPI